VKIFGQGCLNIPRLWKTSFASKAFPRPDSRSGGRVRPPKNKFVLNPEH
jgi:hypothetical protein